MTHKLRSVRRILDKKLLAMNSTTTIFTETIPFDKSLDEVSEQIEKLKTFNIPNHYLKIEESIALIQKVDVSPYEMHFDNFMCIQEPITPLLYNIDILTLNNLKEETKDYVNHLAGVHRLMNVVHTSKEYTCLIQGAYSHYNQALEDFNAMRGMHIDATETLERICREHKGAFAPDSREIGYSRFLLTLSSKITRIDKEIKHQSQLLDNAVNKLVGSLEKLAQDMKLLNSKVDCVTQITDFLTQICNRRVVRHQVSLKITGFIGSMFLMFYIVAVFKQFEYSWCFAALLALCLIHSLIKIYKFKTYMKALIDTNRELKTVFNNATKKALF